MQLISVNVGEERAMQNGKPSGKTGIYKMPVQGPVRITKLGLERDVICDTKNHGGVDQAVYIYGGIDYGMWSRELDAPVAPGTFGENLTISDLESGPVAIGDRFLIGDVVLEVTSCRIPCNTLAVRMGDPDFIKRFRSAEMPGIYCRVIQEGSVQAGMPVVYEPYTGEKVTMLDMFRDYYAPDLSEAQLRRYLSVPTHYKDRARKEKQLRELVEGKG